MPLGVVAGNVPFNFPAMIPWGWMVPMAIATGNTIVLKAASLTPLTSMRILELFYEEGGFPKGVVKLVTCSRKEAELLLTDSRVKAVTFVGTTDIGKHIYSTAAAHGKRAESRAPYGYVEHEYDQLLAFMEQTNSAGVKNGTQLSSAYDPNDPETWGGIFW